MDKRAFRINNIFHNVNGKIGNPKVGDKYEDRKARGLYRIDFDLLSQYHPVIMEGVPDYTLGFVTTGFDHYELVDDVYYLFTINSVYELEEVNCNDL